MLGFFSPRRGAVFMCNSIWMVLLLMP